MDPKEFEKLCQSIEKTIYQAAQKIEKETDVAGNVIKEAVKSYKEASKAEAANGTPNKQTPAQPFSNTQIISPYLMKRRFASSAKVTVCGVILAALGGTALFTFVTLVLGLLIAVPLTTEYAGLAVGITALFAVLSAFVLGAGVKQLKCTSRFKAFKRIFGNREVCTFKELSAQLNITEEKALKSAQKMLKKGLLPEGHIDNQNTCLMVTNGAYNLYRQTQQDRIRRNKELQTQAAQAAERNARLSEEVKTFLKQGQGFLVTLRKLDDDIDDAPVSAKIVQIEEVCTRIFTRVENEPSALDSMDRLMSYYLPTTVKLLEAYDELEQQPSYISSIAQSRAEIEQTLDVLHKAFEKMLDESYRDLTIDLSSDITALNAILAQEGLTENPFEKK
ncbi:MAG: 5-bromo-4-chloroindolyl phosphate hydrolysis family protein [Anaerotardibacter sp.]